MVCNYSQCGIDFEPRRPWQKYHSLQCKMRSYRARRHGSGSDATQKPPANAFKCVKVTHSAGDPMLEVTRTRIAAEIETLGEIRRLVRLAERTLALLQEQTLSG